MACHMVALPAAYVNTVGWESKGADGQEDCTQGKRRSDTGRDWLNYLVIAAGGAEASYDWLGESAAWASMTTTGDEETIQSAPVIEQLPRIETIAIDSPHLSCATTPTPTTRGFTRPAYSSIKTPWVRTGSRSLRCTPRDTPAGPCAPRSGRTAAVSRLTSSSSAELLTTSPSLMLAPRLRGLAQLAQGSDQPREPTTAPPPLRSPSTSASPGVLVLELEQNVSVTNTKLEDGVGLYEITWSDKYDRLHTVWRRYSDFSALHMSLCDDRMVGETVESIDFPPKRPLSSFSRAQRERLLAERRDILENYLGRLVLEGIVSPGKSDAAGEQLAVFLKDDDTEEC